MEERTEGNTPPCHFHVQTVQASLSTFTDECSPVIYSHR